MKKILYFSLLLLIAAQGAWAWEHDYYPQLLSPTPSEGPWTYDAFNSDVVDNANNYRSFNSLTHEAWRVWDDDDKKYGTKQRQDDNGLGFHFHCNVARSTYYIMYSTYYHHDTVPPYTRRQLTWDYSIYGMFGNWCIALFAHDDMDALKNLWTYVTIDKDAGTGDNRKVFNLHTNPHCLNYYKGQTSHTKNGSKVFEFDNRNGSETTVKSWNLLLTFVVYESDAYEEHEGSSAFKSRNEKWDTFYYKYISFDANGGVGTMATQEIENSGNLTANAFARVGYAFQGWATELNGSVVYADGAEVTATAQDKGPVTLYAVWKPTVANVIAAIDAIGEVVYTAECKAHIDDVRALYNELSAEDKNAVTNYNTLVAAEATYLAIQNVVTKITAIGEVTAASGTAIAAAREAYNNLTEAQKPLVINYSALVEAEAQYAILPVVAAIDAIGTVTAESGTAIAAARTAYDALSNTRKSLVTNYATLLAAEAAYADLGKTTVLYLDKVGTDTIHTQRKSIEYPDLPAGASKWQTVERSVSADSTIVIKATE